MSMEIKLTHGKTTIVDDENFEELSKYKWYAYKSRHTFYAVRMFLDVDGKRRQLFMHRIILSSPKGMITDHVNRNGLDNQKSNLRMCSIRENASNQEKRNGCSSKYKGVYKHKCGKWGAQIKHNGVQIRLGLYVNEEDAARAYDKKAKELAKNFAYINGV